MDQNKREELEKFAVQIRIGTVEAIKSRGFGHIGGSLSICDVLAVLYGDILNIDPQDPKKPDRDKVVCSKGHAGPALYATLALKGYFPYDDIKTLNQPGTNFPSHCDRNKTPGIDMTTGSLGQGSSLAVGMAMGDKLKGRDSKTYLIVGDGEIDEGQVWEAAMLTAAKKVTNVIWLIDNNKKQLDGYTKDILDTFDLRKKFEVFGFDAVRIDGNDVGEIYDALSKEPGEKPMAIVLDTIKGKGVKEVEETMSNHSMNVPEETFDRWIDQLKGDLAAFE